jgi:TPR repeat protein
VSLVARRAGHSIDGCLSSPADVPLTSLVQDITPPVCHRGATGPCELECRAHVPGACHSLAPLEEGLCVPPERAVSLYTADCDMPHGAASCERLAELYEKKGKGEPEDYEKSVVLYYRACDAGSNVACVHAAVNALSGMTPVVVSAVIRDAFLYRACSRGGVSRARAVVYTADGNAGSCGAVPGCRA